MSTIVFTERLELRHFSLNDAQGFFDMNNDTEVIQYTGDRAFMSLMETETFIREYDHYQRYGYGRWSIYHRQSGVYLGFCGLKFSPDKQETDLGFRLMRKYWNKGYATEAARVALDVGFGRFDLAKIVGRAMADNAASLRVLEKLGMERKFEYQEAGKLWVQKEIDADKYHYPENRSLPA